MYKYSYLQFLNIIPTYSYSLTFMIIIGSEMLTLVRSSIEGGEEIGYWSYILTYSISIQVVQIDFNSIDCRL